MSSATIEPPEANCPREYSMLIDGEWLEAADGARYDSINPYTGKVWARIPAGRPGDVERAVRAARNALDHGAWGRLNGVERAALMRRLAALVEANAPALAAVETTDNGKLLRETRFQAEALAGWLYYYAGLADKIHGRTIPSDKPGFLVYTRREPVGVVGAITPWNSPLLLLMWKLAPALAAGCPLVVKPADQTSASTLELGRLFAEAGFPPGVFNVVTGVGAECGKALVRSPGVDKIAFTGSTAAGIDVMKGAADNLTQVSLELGGKSPNIVFADADLDAVQNGVIAGIFAASGQTCIAGSRLFVHESVAEALVERLVERARSIVIGDPMAAATEMGPVALTSQLDSILGYIETGRSEGATLVTGGARPSPQEVGDGYFVQPTIFTGVRNDMRIAREEIFGPVLSVLTFKDEDDVIAQANDSDFGLAAGIWTNDIRRAHRVADALRVGTVWVNSYRAVSFTSPFGGYKMSGLGRENGVDALDEYLETKTVWVELAGQSRDPFRMG
ncbi:aldehyde dehydrogenase [Streptomyces sp. NPDC058287]|uniref:aldehyde dehydrogenase n=3 Tax=unclassified Streptomyces TaxID=2593676 RepID=UPI0036EF1BA3